MYSINLSWRLSIKVFVSGRVKLVGVIFLVFLILSLFYGRPNSCGISPVLPDFSDGDLMYLSGVAYLAVEDGLDGGQPPVFDDRFDGVCNKVYVLFRVSGKVIGSAGFISGNLAESVYKASTKVFSKHACEGFYSCPTGFNPRDFGRLQVELYVLGDKQLIRNPQMLLEKRLRTYNGEFEPGIHSLGLEGRDSESFILSSAAIIGDLDTPRIVERLCGELGLSEECVTQDNVSAYRYNTLHFTADSPSTSPRRLYR